TAGGRLQRLEPEGGEERRASPGGEKPAARVVQIHGLGRGARGEKDLPGEAGGRLWIRRRGDPPDGGEVVPSGLPGGDDLHPVSGVVCRSGTAAGATPPVPASCLSLLGEPSDPGRTAAPLRQRPFCNLPLPLRPHRGL